MASVFFSFDGDLVTLFVDVTITNTPDFVSGTADGSTVVLTFDDSLDGASVPASGSFSVTGSSSGSHSVASVGVSGTDVTLTLSTPVVNAESVTADYVPPVTDPLQDPDGNDAPGFGGEVLTNLTAPPGPLTLIVNNAADAVDANPGDGVCETSTPDECTLRAAIMEANATLGGTDTINVPAGTYTLTISGGGEDAAATGDLDITDDLAITASGGAVIDGNGIVIGDRALHVLGTASVVVDGLDITNGRGQQGGGILLDGTELQLLNLAVSDHLSALEGGGVHVASGRLVLLNSAVFDNSATFGGGIYNLDTVGVTLSTLTGNFASGLGGGIANVNAATATITDSTLSGNTALGGGGISNNGATPSLTITGSTISGNIATEGGGAGISNNGTGGQILVENSTVSGSTAGTLSSGGGLFNFAGSATLTNVTVTDNSAGSGGGVWSGGTVTFSNTIVGANNDDCSGAGLFVSLGNNLNSDDSNCMFETATDLQGAPPLLGPLADNGGPTLTHALLAGSPAIDHGDTVLTVDQRGVARSQGAADDIGAFELEPLGPLTLVVDSTADGGDATPGDGVCDDGTGNCTLRAAIGKTNAVLGGTDTINFAIPGPAPHVIAISSGSSLPAITGAVTIDGGPAGASIVRVDGASAAAVRGFEIAADNVTIANISVTNFIGAGVLIISGEGNTVAGNYIGVDTTGLIAAGNGFGVQVASSNNTIGGPDPGDGNVLSASVGGPLTGHGVTLGEGADGNVIQNNIIGLGSDGETELGNAGDGVSLFAASNSVIDGNVISANGGQGVKIGPRFVGGGISVPAVGNMLLNNRIGTSADGLLDLGNGENGVQLDNAQATIVGASGAGNVISGNGQNGVNIFGADTPGNTIAGNYIGTDVNGMTALGNAGFGVAITDAAGNTIGGATEADRNVISGNGGNGVSINGSASDGNDIRGNYIGTDAIGTAALGNDGEGIGLFGAINTAIANNVIADSAFSGIMIADGASGTQVQGNYIGTDKTGTLDLGNTFNGVAMVDSPSNTIGGTDGTTPGGPCTGDCNVISGNGTGIEVFDAGATGNQILGNYIGTRSSGAEALSNSGSGIAIVDASSNTVADNVISGNDGNGVSITGVGASGNVLLGNLIGTNAAGSAPLPNLAGVAIDGAPNNTVGAAEAGARNVISGNTGDGVLITGTAASGNDVRGNYMGTDATGVFTDPTPLSPDSGDELGNLLWGVQIINAPDNTVDGNVISGNGHFEAAPIPGDPDVRSARSRWTSPARRSRAAGSRVRPP